MARPKKYQAPIIEENIPQKEKNNIEPVIEIKNDAPVKEKHTYPFVIANDNKSVFRKMPTLDPKHIVGPMPANVSYKIKAIVNSEIYGKFYKLSNDYYVIQRGNYTVKE